MDFGAASTLTPFMDPYTPDTIWQYGTPFMFDCGAVVPANDAAVLSCTSSCQLDGAGLSPSGGFPAVYASMYGNGCSGNRYISKALTPGTYAITYYGAESYFQVGGANGRRVFNLLVEGVLVFPFMNVVELAGANNRAYNFTFLFPIADGRATVQLTAACTGCVDSPNIRGLRFRYVDDSLNLVRPSVPYVNSGSEVPGYTEDFIYSAGPVEIAFATREVTLTALAAMTLKSAKFSGNSGNFPAGWPVFKATLFVPDGSSYTNITNVGDTSVNIGGESGIPVNRGDTLRLSILFRPDVQSFYNTTFSITNSAGKVVMQLFVFGYGDEQARTPHITHPVAHFPQSINQLNTIINADGNGVQSVILDGSVSHTHEIGKSIVVFQWVDTNSGTVLSNAAVATTNLPVGSTLLTLNIADNSNPPRLDSVNSTVIVVPPTMVPGCFVKYYAGTNPTLADTPVYAEIQSLLTSGGDPDNLDLNYLPDAVSTYINDQGLTVLVQFTCFNPAQTAGSHSYAMTFDSPPPAGTPTSQIYTGASWVNLPFTGTVSNSQAFSWVFWVKSTTQLPAVLLLDGATTAPALYYHNENNLDPVITSVTPTQGSEIGGNDITITALAFRPSDVTVWLNNVQQAASVIKYVDPTKLTVTMPASVPRKVTITIVSKTRRSNGIDYTYVSKDDPQIKFTRKVIPLANSPLHSIWCHNRTYVVFGNSSVAEYAFSEDYEIVGRRIFNAFQANAAIWGKTALSLACDPWEPSNSAWKLYISSSVQFGNERISQYNPVFNNTRGSEYGGFVHYLVAPNFAQSFILVKNAPCAIAFHGTGGAEFDNNREYSQMFGHLDNAGSPERAYGFLPDSPLSGTCTKMQVYQPDFDGNLEYEFVANAPDTCNIIQPWNRNYDSNGNPGLVPMPGTVVNSSVRTWQVLAFGKRGLDGNLRSPMDQRVGHLVQLKPKPGQYIRVAAQGVRNALGLLMLLNGDMYISDNGPNFDSGWGLNGPPGPMAGIGANERSCNWTRTADYADSGVDKFFLFSEGAYYGTPNMNRAFAGDTRQWYFHHPLERVPYPANPATAPFTPAVYNPSSSSNGMDEYRSNTFYGKMKGVIILCHLNSNIITIRMRNNITVQEVLQDSQYNGALPLPLPCLSVRCFPGGTCLLNHDNNNTFIALQPDDSSATLLPLRILLWDIFPYRAPANVTVGAKYEFTLSGVNFNLLQGAFKVLFGGAEATIVGRTDKRIYGYIPKYNGPAGIVDVQLVDTVLSDTYTLAQSFRYLKDVGPAPVLIS